MAIIKFEPVHKLMVLEKKATAHSGVGRKFCPIKCCFENTLGIKGQVSAKMSVSEYVQENLWPD